MPALAATVHTACPLATPSAVKTPPLRPPASALRIVSAVSCPGVTITTTARTRKAPKWLTTCLFSRDCLDRPGGARFVPSRARRAPARDARPRARRRLSGRLRLPRRLLARQERRRRRGRLSRGALAGDEGAARGKAAARVAAVPGARPGARRLPGGGGCPTDCRTRLRARAQLRLEHARARRLRFGGAAGLARDALVRHRPCDRERARHPARRPSRAGGFRARPP